MAKIVGSNDALRDALALLAAVADDDQEAVRVILELGDPAEIALLLARLFTDWWAESGQDIGPAVRLARREIPEELSLFSRRAAGPLGVP